MGSIGFLPLCTHTEIRSITHTMGSIGNPTLCTHTEKIYKNKYGKNRSIKIKWHLLLGLCDPWGYSLEDLMEDLTV